jgi:CheY-like chemotaxis protein
MKVMIVDDVASNCALLERIVRNKFGCDVITAANGKEALALLPSQMPNILLLDLMMPEMSGIELLQILRSSEEWKNLPVIIISAVSDRSMIRDVALLGISGYLLKPFSAIDVSERVAEALKKNPI